jgi:hypothetical protein
MVRLFLFYTRLLGWDLVTEEIPQILAKSLF